MLQNEISNEVYDDWADLTSQDVDLLIERQLVSKSLYEFIKRAWAIVEPTAVFVDNWHIRMICEQLQRVSLGELTNVIINVPPGMMKSLIVSVFWPAWEWGAVDSSLRYLCASYSAHLATRDNMRVRNLVASEWYRLMFPAFKIDSTQDAKGLFYTADKGWRFGTSVGGAGTGEHPDRVIIDDPHSAAQARSDAERKHGLDWFDQTISTRGVSRKARTVIIMQRLHVEDLTGHLLQKGGWTHICLPMHYDPSRPDPLDVRTAKGELLWPSLFPPDVVRKLEIALTAYPAAGQLEQKPTPEGGGMFKREWFRILEAVPAGPFTECRGWDTAATETDDADYTVGAKIRRIGDLFVVMNVNRGQWSPATVDAMMRQTAVLDGRFCRQREEKEPGSSGKTVIAARTKLMAGYDYGGVQVDQDKVTRSRPFRSQCEAGNVALLAGPWVEAYLSELADFPVGKNDDQVDASSCAFNELTAGPSPVKQVEVTWG